MKQLIWMVSFLALFTAGAGANANDFETLVDDLNGRSYSAKRKAIDKLREVDDPRTVKTLQAMSDGVLFLHKSSQSLVIGKESEQGWILTDVKTEEVVDDAASSSAFKKVKINNSVRGKLRTAIASIELGSSSSKVRLQSARNLIKKPDESLREIIVEAIEKETNSSIKQEMAVALAMIDIQSDDRELRKKSIESLSDSVSPEAVAILSSLVKQDEDGNYAEEDETLRKLAAKSLESAESKISFFKFFENLFFGMSLGSVLLLAAIGLAITFGVMGVINMAHGEMMMLGAYTTFAIQQLFPSLIDWSLLLAIPAAFLVSGCVGILIERTVIRHLYGRPLDTLLATFGISLVLQQLVRTYRANNVPVVTPDWLAGSWVANGALSVTYNRIYIFIFALLVLLALAMLLKKTLVGLQMRAVTQNRAMANSMGIKSNWVDALTFGLGSGIAGIAGVALSQITNVGPNMGQDYIIDSFMVVVFGGVGNLLGTLFAATGLGIINKFLEPTVGAVVGKIIVLVFIILFIQWRPRGLFALKGRFVED